MADRVRAAAGAAGVLLLTAGWATSGLLTDGFDPVRQSISQLQREGAATSQVMTASFVGFAAGCLSLAPVVRRRVGRAPQRLLLVVAAATLGAAVSPLGEVRGGTQDSVHLAFGATGYTCLSLLPLLAGARLHGWARTASLLLGTVASACLLATVPADAYSGALQRVGFLAGHAWLLGFSVSVLYRRPPAGTCSG